MFVYTDLLRVRCKINNFEINNFIKLYPSGSEFTLNENKNDQTLLELFKDYNFDKLMKDKDYVKICNKVTINGYNYQPYKINYLSSFLSEIIIHHKYDSTFLLKYSYGLDYKYNIIGYLNNYIPNIIIYKNKSKIIHPLTIFWEEFPDMSVTIQLN